MNEMINKEVIKIANSWIFNGDDSHKAREILIAALEENESFKEENEDLTESISSLRETVKDQSETIKMLEELNKINREEKEKANNALKTAVKELSDASLKLGEAEFKIDKLEEVNNCLREQLDAYNNQMSAVEVLDFMKTKFFTSMLEVFGNTTYQKIFEEYTPQEIVDKIQAYEQRNLNHNAGTQKESEMSNEPEFKVGDLVMHKDFGLGKVTNVFTDSVIVDSYVYGNDRRWHNNNIEHVEQPKEEKVKWVWEVSFVGYDDHVYVKAIYDTEEEAIKHCEEHCTKRNFGYRKVCRVKE